MNDNALCRKGLRDTDFTNGGCTTGQHVKHESGSLFLLGDELSVTDIPDYSAVTGVWIATGIIFALSLSRTAIQ